MARNRGHAWRSGRCELICPSIMRMPPSRSVQRTEPSMLNAWITSRIQHVALDRCLYDKVAAETAAPSTPKYNGRTLSGRGDTDYFRTNPQDPGDSRTNLTTKINNPFNDPLRHQFMSPSSPPKLLSPLSPAIEYLGRNYLSEIYPCVYVAVYLGTQMH